MAYVFTKDLETGNMMIDQQHKQLIDAINRLLEACAQGKGRAEIEKTMAFMSDYTVRHFGDEEKLQMQHMYPDYINHKKYHEAFKQVVREIQTELQQSGPTVALTAKINMSIAGWLLNHIKKEDVKVAAHIKAKTGK